MHDEMTNIKRLAKEAKARMKSGFWADVKQRRNDDVAIAASSGKSTDAVIKDYTRMLKSKIYKGLSGEDEIFYRKVCALLDSEEVVINPIGRLADDELLATLTDEAKHHYIFEISDKYKKMKERYEAEKKFLGKV